MTKNLLFAVLILFSPMLTFAEGKIHRVVFQITDDNSTIMNEVLTNISNVTTEYDKIGDTMIAEVVAYGPGLDMLIADKSPVKQRVEAATLEFDNLTFTACGNSIASREKQTGQKVQLIDGVKIAKAGVLRIIELQEQGFAYVKP